MLANMLMVCVLGFASRDVPGVESPDMPSRHVVTIQYSVFAGRLLGRRFTSCEAAAKNAVDYQRLCLGGVDVYLRYQGDDRELACTLQGRIQDEVIRLAGRHSGVRIPVRKKEE
jgi:hypothetical protein